MGNYFEPVLSEEQLAAYLDGMTTVEENSMIENAISADMEMQEIADTLDDVDATYVNYDESAEIPVECLADDFELPVLDLDADIYADMEESQQIEMYADRDFSEYEDDYLEGGEEDIPQDDTFYDDSYDDVSF